VDELDKLEQEGRERREQRKAARKTPEARAKRNRGRIQRNRGYRAEKNIERRLSKFQFYRVPLSGALGGERFSGDLRRDTKSCLRVLEVKHRRGAQKQMRSWLAQGNADAVVVVPGGGQEPLVFMELKKLEQLLLEASTNDA